MSHFKTFETERLILESTTTEDAEFVLRLFNTPKWLKYIGDRGVNTIEEATLYITMRMKPQMERLGFSNYTIIRRSDFAKIGICGLYDRAGLDGFDIGFALLPEFEGNGYAFEAASKLKQVAFDELGLTEIQAITSQDNTASQKLIEKLGLEFIGLVRLPNDTEDLFLYKTFLFVE